MESMEKSEKLVLQCVKAMLLMPAVEYMTIGDIARAASMIAASHPRPANGRVEGTAMWMTALCVRFAMRFAPRGETVDRVLGAMLKASHNLPAERERVADEAGLVTSTRTYHSVLRLGGTCLALAVRGASSHQIPLSEKDREACVRLWAAEPAG